MTRRCWDIKYLLREVDSLWLWPNLIAVGFCVSLPCCPLGPSRICAPCSLVLPESVVGLGALIHEDLLGPLWYCSPAVVGCSVKNDKGFASVEKVPGSHTAGEEHKFTLCKTLDTWDTGLESLDKCTLLLSVCPLWGMCQQLEKPLPFSLISEAESDLHSLRDRPASSVFLLADTLEKQ